MKVPEKPTTLLLDCAVDLMFEIYLMRGDCSVLAKSLVEKGATDELALEECARLDDTLANVYRTLQSTLKGIQHTRASRAKRAN